MTQQEAIQELAQLVRQIADDIATIANQDIYLRSVYERMADIASKARDIDLTVGNS